MFYWWSCNQINLRLFGTLTSLLSFSVQFQGTTTSLLSFRVQFQGTTISLQSFRVLLQGATTSLLSFRGSNLFPAASTPAVFRGVLPDYQLSWNIYNVANAPPSLSILTDILRYLLVISTLDIVFKLAPTEFAVIVCSL